jgi:hypothetical protein
VFGRFCKILLIFYRLYNIDPSEFLVLGSIMCKVLPNLLEGCKTFSLWILTILARSRYQAISNPLQLTKHEKLKIYLVLFITA